jgi:mono/diheme cytochrome c family protein
MWTPALLTIALAIGAMAQSSPVSKAPAAAQVARGRYLVERTGMCADCHTPMNQKGEPIKERHLGGAPLMFKPTVPVPGWAEVAPPIAGLPGFTDEQAVRFLTTGIGSNGKPAGPPMPAFRFNKQDATAIVAYLRSLKPSEGASTPTKAPKPAAKSGQQ